MCHFVLAFNYTSFQNLYLARYGLRGSPWAKYEIRGSGELSRSEIQSPSMGSNLKYPHLGQLGHDMLEEHATNSGISSELKVVRVSHINK